MHKAVILALLAATMARAQTVTAGARAVVNSDTLPVYASMSDTTEVKVTLKRGDVVIIGLDRDVHPVLEVVGPILGIDGPDVPFVKQDQRAANRSDLHRLENPVQNQYVAIEHIAS